MSNILQFSERLHKACTGLSELVDACPGIENTSFVSVLRNLSSRIPARNKFSAEIVFLNTPDQWMCDSIGKYLTHEFNGAEIVRKTEESPFIYQFNVVFSGIEVEISAYNSAHIPVRQTGDILPEIKLVCHSGQNVPSEDELGMVALRLTKDACLMLLISETDFNLQKANEDVQIVKKKLSDLESSSLSTVWEDPKMHEFVAGLRLQNQMLSLSKVNESFNQFLQQQDKEIKSRKINVQYDTNAVKADEKVNYRDRFQKIKLNFQKELSEVEKKAMENSALLLRPSANGLIASFESKIDKIDHFDEETIGDKIKMRVPKDIKQNIIDELKDALRDRIKRDLFVTTEIINENQQIIHKELTELHGNVNLNFKEISDVHINSLIDDFTDFSQKYEIEKKKLGPTDFLRAATAPLMALFSLSTLYMVIYGERQNMAEVFSNGYVRIIGVAAILTSLYLFIRKIKKSEKHLYDSELEKIQTNMKSEVRSTLKRLTDEWIRSYSTQLREEVVRFMGEVENVFNDLTDNHREQLLRNQRSTQRKIQTLEQEERTYQNQMRNKENFERAFMQMKNEIMQSFSTATRNISL